MRVLRAHCQSCLAARAKPVAQFTAGVNIGAGSLAFGVLHIAVQCSTVNQRRAGRGLFAERVDHAVQYTFGDEGAVAVTLEVFLDPVFVVG